MVQNMVLAVVKLGVLSLLVGVLEMVVELEHLNGLIQGVQLFW